MGSGSDGVPFLTTTYGSLAITDEDEHMYPLGQLSHQEEPKEENVFCGQGSGFADPVRQNEPSGHTEHVIPLCDE